MIEELLGIRNGKIICKTQNVLDNCFFVLFFFKSGYFSSMFSGSWKESSMNIIELEIPDQNIDIEGNPHHNYCYAEL